MVEFIGNPLVITILAAIFVCGGVVAVRKLLDDDSLPIDKAENLFMICFFMTLLGIFVIIGGLIAIFTGWGATAILQTVVGLVITCLILFLANAPNCMTRR